MINTLLATLTLLAPAAAKELPAGPSPLTNPYKGYAPYAQEGTLHTFPHTMVYHYVSWRDLEPERKQYRIAEWENKTWNAPLSKGKRLVLRIYLEYPTQPTGLPQWLLDSGIKMTPFTDHGGGKSPDYSNPLLRQGLQELIREVGKRWNKDDRVAFIQMGILGHWGEWHTWPREDLWAPPEVQREVINGMRAAFPNKHLMGRNPIGFMGEQPWIGYHDDMIPQDTIGPDEWMFLPTMRRAGRQDNWKVAPTGGEMVPGQSRRYLGEEWDLTVKAVKEAKFSWIGPYCPAMVDEADPQYKQRREELSKMLGYEFRWTKAAIPAALKRGTKGEAQLDGLNQGVAPFYYPWPLRTALIDSAGKVAATADSPADIRKWLPGPIQARLVIPGAPKPGRYEVGVGLIDPLTKAPGVEFANKLPKKGGYYVIGQVTVR